jgi:hypothetical protein
MLRLPIHGFTNRADDTIAPAMAILKNRPNCTSKSSDSAPEDRSKGQSAG